MCLLMGGRMKTKSAKAKGRRLQNYVAEKFNEYEGYKCRPAIMGEAGADIKWYEQRPPGISIECKNQEQWSIHKWWEQTKKNAKEETPVLIVKKNGEEPLIIMRFDDWIEEWIKRY